MIAMVITTTFSMIIVSTAVPILPSLRPNPNPRRKVEVLGL